jgi:GNAT superfamily N-acetyltransferase
MHVPVSRDEVLAIERAAVAAWPALETADINGWLWRYSGGGSQRANSVSSLRFCGSDVDSAIAAAEARYRTRGAAPMFQICDVNVPADLDERLERRGYRLQELCTCLAKRIGPDAGAGIEADVERAEEPSEAWLSVYLAGITLSRRRLAPKILAGVPTPRAFLLCRDQSEALATALCVVAEGVAVAECVATRADRRRAGAATRIMRALEAWGARQGASIAALQAVAANAPAQGLYAKLAYTRFGGYHYRVLDS